jgi:tetratricopeptide (TPR) repeat protein
LLARARHPHIVEILAHAATDDDALFLLCMPFLGGASLAEILPALRRRRAGHDLLLALEQVSAPELAPQTAHSLAHNLIASLDYPHAIAWIIARLADALDAAWHRGITHGDLKPANILITALAVPMLLDFNLAVDWSQTADLPPETGGTLAYMAPERLRILAQRDAPRIAPRPRDRHIADLYSLGLVFLECLTGRLPALPPIEGHDTRAFAASLAKLREHPPTLPRAIPHSLKPIFTRLLDPNPAFRYASGADLAADLDRWRAGRQPLHAIPSSTLGQVRILAPRVLARARTLALPAAAILLLLALFTGWLQAESRARDHARAAYARILSGREPDVFRFHRLPAWNDLESSRPALAASRFLDQFQVLDPGDWRASPLVRHLPEPDRSDLHAWILEQAYRLAYDLSLPTNPPADWVRALAVLAQIRMGPTPDAFLQLEERLLKQSGRAATRPLTQTKPAPPWLNLYLEAIHAELIGETKHAWDLYQQSRRLEPQAFWPRYRSAVMAYRLGWFREAADDLRVCIRRAPENAALHAQLAGCLFELGDFEHAVYACDQAVTLDPDLVPALKNRLQLRRSLNPTTTLLNDLDQLTRLTNWNDQASPWLLRLEILEAGGIPVPVEGDSELSWRNLMHQTGNAEVAFLTGLRYLQIDQPSQAKTCFEYALRLHPHHLPARMFRAQCLWSLNQRRAGLREYAQIASQPDFDALVGVYKPACRILHTLAQAYHSREPERSAEVMKAAFRLVQDAPSFLAETYYTQALLLAREPSITDLQLDRIVEALTSAYTIDPHSLLDHDRYRKARSFDFIRARLNEKIARLPGGHRLIGDAPEKPSDPPISSSFNAPSRKSGAQPGPEGPVGK